jgi:type I restriction enzyme, S subunit
MIANLKPYPVMKNTGLPWLAEVPELWEAIAVRRYCRVFAGATPSRVVPAYWNGGTIPWLTSGDVNLRRIGAASQFITESGHASSSTKWIRPGSVVLALAGQGRTKGMVATVECHTTCNQSLAAIEPSRSRSDHRFLAYYLESRYLDLRALVGDGLRDGLNLEHVRAIATPLPPLPEQAAIVQFLDYADRRIRRFIRAKQKLIKLLEEQKQAIIQRVVTRGLDPNVPLKPSGVEWLGDVPAHWDVVSLRRVIRRTVDGPHHSPKYVDNGVPFISARNIKIDHWRLDDAKYISGLDYEQFCRRVVPELGDVLYTKGGTTGIARVVDLTFPFQVWVHVAVLKLIKSRVTPHFLAACLNSPRCYEQAQLFTRGATNQDLGLSRMKGIVFALPPLHEQAKIVDDLDTSMSRMSGAIETAQHQISLLREYRTRLIADVVIGKLDVREAAARLPEAGDQAEPLEDTEALAADEDADADADELDAVLEEAEA